MEKIILLLAIILFSCEKIGTYQQNKDVPDEIIYQQIDKTIFTSEKDTILGNIIFELTANQHNGFNSVLTCNSDSGESNSINYILTTPQTDIVFAADENINISKDGNWNYEELNLNHFAGLGEKYIGYCSCSFSDGQPKYWYGWIKIELSKNIDTLKIICRAKNNTVNQPIKSGQIK